MPAAVDYSDHGLVFDKSEDVGTSEQASREVASNLERLAASKYQATIVARKEQIKEQQKRARALDGTPSPSTAPRDSKAPRRGRPPAGGKPKAPGAPASAQRHPPAFAAGPARSFGEERSLHSSVWRADTPPTSPAPCSPNPPKRPPQYLTPEGSPASPTAHSDSHGSAPGEATPTYPSVNHVQSSSPVLRPPSPGPSSPAVAPTDRPTWEAVWPAFPVPPEPNTTRPVSPPLVRPPVDSAEDVLGDSDRSSDAPLSDRGDQSPDVCRTPISRRQSASLLGHNDDDESDGLPHSPPVPVESELRKRLSCLLPLLDGAPPVSMSASAVVVEDEGPSPRTSDGLGDSDEDEVMDGAKRASGGLRPHGH
eukprot:TRINITY_DN3039_c0_g1_i1.p1 TRINITY_DN3039_c0_g1~~TRINITY_DN3039_c0_g1_i1.p1  ORF type:complete len:380 (+),score=55.61 TRINITY_DN3039_c0_g1_i1:45-1142(+)